MELKRERKKGRSAAPKKRRLKRVSPGKRENAIERNLKSLKVNCSNWPQR